MLLIQWVLPLVSLLVLPIGRLEYALLGRTRWAALLAGVAVLALYAPWLLAAGLGYPIAPSAAGFVLGAAQIAAGLFVWLKAIPALMRVPGQGMARPRSLLTDGAYSWTRHPLYVGHVAVISGLMLCLGAPRLFLETPLLWLIAALAAGHEEREILAPTFPSEFVQYRSRVPFLLTARGWALWGCLYVSLAILQYQGLLRAA
jgi:protein-S-isoprenylcysteine O-methyltransferase Ste14